jgi:hypothetical protein
MGPHGGFFVRRSLTPVAVVLVAVYLALGILASACLFGQAASQPLEHHHHSGQAAHSTICLWACQANSDTSLLSMAPTPQPLLLGLGLILFLFQLPPTPRLELLRSRAPPR